MIIKCLSCGKQFKAGAKLVEGLKALPAGGKKRLKCPKCSSLFDVNINDLTGATYGVVTPPSAPDISWLQVAGQEEIDLAEEMPTALLLIRRVEMRSQLETYFREMGYRVETAADADEVIEKMQFFQYAAVVLHADFIDGDLASSKVHSYIISMDMRRRRKMFYFLMGPEFKTLYDLEALAYSANQVICDQDIEYFPLLMNKLVREYDVLFGPLLKEMQAAEQ